MSMMPMEGVIGSLRDTLLLNAVLLSELGTGDGDSITTNPFKSDNAVYPYIVIASAQDESFDTNTTYGSLTFVTLSVFDNSGNAGNVIRILAQIKESLHDSTLMPLVGSDDIVYCFHDGLSEWFFDDQANRVITQGVSRYRILTTSH